MNNDQASQILNQLVAQLHKTGSITVTPESFEQIAAAVRMVTAKPEKANTKK